MRPIPQNESFQSGGNLSLVTGNLASRVDGTLSDPTGLGRWHGVILSGKQGQKLTIIMAYRVCAGSVKTASMGSAYYREHEHFSKQGHKSVNPRRLFLRDLKETITQLQDQGHATILMLDANATPLSDPHFADFMEACTLLDLHDNDPAPSTYIGADNRRIDYILGCDQIKLMLRRSGTLAYTEGPQSDHRSLYVDLHIDFLVGAEEKIDKSLSRGLYTGNPELVSAYNKTVLKYYNDHRMIDRMDDLYKNFASMSREDIRAKLISLDNDQGRVMRLGESQLSKPAKSYSWSPELRNLAYLRLYWKLRLREALHASDYSNTFLRWQTNLQTKDATFVFPNLTRPLTVDVIRSELNKASKRFRECQKNSESSRMKCYDDLLDEYENDTNPTTRAESKRPESEDRA